MSAVELDSAGPIHSYRKLVKAGELNHDPVQERSAEKLQSLHHRLQGYDPGKEKSVRRLFQFGLIYPEATTWVTRWQNLRKCTASQLCR